MCRESFTLRKIKIQQREEEIVACLDDRSLNSLLREVDRAGNKKKKDIGRLFCYIVRAIVSVAWSITRVEGDGLILSIVLGLWSGTVVLAVVSVYRSRETVRRNARDLAVAMQQLSRWTFTYVFLSLFFFVFVFFFSVLR